MNVATPPAALPPGDSAPPLTLAAVCRRIEADDSLSKARRANLRSAIACFCRACGLSPADAPADVTWLVARAGRLHPVQARMSAKRLANVRAEVAFAIRRYLPGPYALRGRGGLTPPWQELWALLPTGQLRWRLSRFLRFLSIQGCSRIDLDDALVAQFRGWLTTATTAKDPESVVKQTVRTWNRAASSVPGWPQQTLTDVWGREAYTRPWDALPATLRADAEAWLETLRHPDILDEHAPKRALSEATIHARRFQIRQIFAALVHSGIDPDSLAELADITSLAHLRTTLRFYLGRSDGRASSQVAGIATAFVLIAEHWIRVEPQELAAMQALRRKVTPDHGGLTAKNQAALRQFDSERNKRLLVNLPSKVLRDLTRKKMLTQADALEAQAALALAILLCLPIRRKNLTLLDLERHVMRGEDDEGRTSVSIVIPAAEVKNREPLAFALNAPAVRILDFYTARCRPLLARHPSSWLFPGGKAGACKAPRNLAEGMKRLIHRRTGLTITPHQMRHVVSKIVLDRHPAEIETVRRLNGHRSTLTTTRTYTGGDTRLASRVLDETLAGLRYPEADNG